MILIKNICFVSLILVKNVEIGKKGLIAVK